MKNKYSIAYMSAVIALPVALLFIVPAVAQTQAYQWYDSASWSESHTGADESQGEDSPENEGVKNEGDETGDDSAGDASYEETSHGAGMTWGHDDRDERDDNDDGSTEDNDWGSDSDEGEWESSYVWGHSYTYSHTHDSNCGHDHDHHDDCDDDCDDHHDDCDDECDDHHDDCDDDCDDYDWCDDHDCSEPEAPTCTLDATPSETWWSGDEVILNWNTEHATNVSISGGIGYASYDGSEAVYPTETTTYVLTATGDGGTVECSETVVVHEPEHEDVSCDAFTASDWNINEGDQVTLNWNTTGASSVVIDQGVGNVAVDGNTNVYLYHDTTFTLTARDGDVVDTCAITVEVADDTNDEVSCDAFTVSDSSVSKGDEVTLQWNTSHADSVSIDQGIGTVVDDGNKVVTINSDTTFTLTARDGEKTDTCTVSVDVKSSGGGGGGSSKKTPYCEFSVSDSEIRSGQSIVLSWINKYTDRLVLKEGTKTLADTKKDKDVDEDKDAMTVSPDKTTTYTLDVYNGSKKRTCELKVEVGKGMVSGISLSQVPYTGFDAGPTLTAIFYTAIVLWGLVLAYVLVLKKKSRTHIQ